MKKYKHRWADRYRSDDGNTIYYDGTICLKCGAGAERSAPLHEEIKFEWLKRFENFYVTKRGAISYDRRTSEDSSGTVAR